MFRPLGVAERTVRGWRLRNLPASGRLGPPRRLRREAVADLLCDVTRPDESSPRWCLRIISELDAADKQASAVAASLNPQQLNWKPSPQQWSVGQCLEHLVLGNNVYIPALSEALENQPTAAVQEITPGWLARFFIRKFIEPSPTMTRARAPRKVVPASHVDASILDRFLESNRALGELARRAASYDVNRIRFRNPFIPGLRFTVGTGFDLSLKHERRHLLQAERVRKQIPR
jgi:hypothetical protein